VPNFSSDANGIARLVATPTGDAGQAVDSNFGAVSTLITTLNAAIGTANGLITALQNGKSAKAPTPTAGHFASLDSGGNVVDSTYSPASFDASGAAGSVGGSLSAHTANTSNPHSVTAAQAGAVPASRTVSTTAPMTGGGALSGNLTLAVSVMVGSGSTHAAGLVPDPGASAGTSKFLREDATWATPSAGTGMLTVPSTSKIAFSSDATDFGTPDVAIMRSASIGNTLKITDGSTGIGNLNVGDVTLNSTVLAGIRTAQLDGPSGAFGLNGGVLALDTSYSKTLRYEPSNGTAVFNVPIVRKAYTVGTLPSPVAGAEAYASDALKPGETTGAGTGRDVEADGSGWFTGDGIAVAS
jgi:hypothetical protein